MIVLNSSDQLYARMTGNNGTSSTFHVNYIDTDDNPGSQYGKFNGITEISICNAPASGKVRLIKTGIICNMESTSRSFIVQVGNGANRYTVGYSGILGTSGIYEFAQQ